MKDNRWSRRLVAVPADLKQHVSVLVQQLGPRDAAKKLGVSRDTAISVAAGLDVMPGSLALIMAHAGVAPAA
jgi:hypothetical protein